MIITDDMPGKGWYGKRSVAFMRLARAGRPVWMEEQDKQHRADMKSIRRNVEKKNQRAGRPRRTGVYIT